MVPVVVIPVLNRYDLLERCLDSLDFPVDKIIIIDNGGKIEEDCLVMPRHSRHGKTYILDMPSNLGVATSWNLGIKMTPFASGWILLTGSPEWACAWIGSSVVRDVGLFCEAFHPAYFEDNDYERRAVRLGVNIRKSQDIIMHDNSSTLLSDVGYQAKNSATFNSNHELFKLRNARLDAGQWDLQRRLDLSWD
jgi:GT2 family glycosyltransferase